MRISGIFHTYNPTRPGRGFILIKFQENIRASPLSIRKANLTVAASTQAILAGDNIPAITFTFAGWQFSDTPEKVFGTDGPSYTVSPVYTHDAGTYIIKPSDSPANYFITAVPGYLYVNPAGSKAKSIDPALSCVEKLVIPVSGYSYIAHFVYYNTNYTDLYIPAGNNNYVSGKGKFSPVNQPSLFTHAGGTFDILFDGTSITWNITSIKYGKTVTEKASASSASTICKTSAKDAVISDETETETDLNPVAYPNPATDKVTIHYEEITEHSSITITDMKGSSYPASILTISDDRLELDTRNLPSGLYIIGIFEGTKHNQFTIVIK